MKQPRFRPLSAIACGGRSTARWPLPSASRRNRRWKRHARQAASALYHITSAVLMTSEAARPGADARRALLARLVLEHRLSARDPLAPQEGEWEQAAAEVLLSERSVSVGEVAQLLA